MFRLVYCILPSITIIVVNHHEIAINLQSQADLSLLPANSNEIYHFSNYVFNLFEIMICSLLIVQYSPVNYILDYCSQTQCTLIYFRISGKSSKTTLISENYNAREVAFCVV